MDAKALKILSDPLILFKRLCTFMSQQTSKSTFLWKVLLLRWVSNYRAKELQKWYEYTCGIFEKKLTQVHGKNALSQMYPNWVRTSTLHWYCKCVIRIWCFRMYFKPHTYIFLLMLRWNWNKNAHLRIYLDKVFWLAHNI